LRRAGFDRGGALLESVLLVPVLAALFVGALEMGKITLTYFTLHQAMRGAARMAATLQGADFCDPEDPQLLALKTFLVYGPEGEGSGPLVRELTPDQIQILPERAIPEEGVILPCPCAGSQGCRVSEGGRAPDYVAATIPDGYPFQPRLPFRVLDPILLRPRVRVPFAGL